MKLSILICTLPERKEMFGDLCYKLQLSMLNPDISDFIILEDDSEVDSIGGKRNRLLQRSNSDYVCFIDDDDDVSNNYVRLLMEGINKGVDCCSLEGVYSVDGVKDGVFEHSLRYKEWKTTGNEIKYERYPNHLNCIKASIAKQFKFPEKNFGEDHDWSTQIHKSGLLKTEHRIEQPIYFYNKRTK